MYCLIIVSRLSIWPASSLPSLINDLLFYISYLNISAGWPFSANLSKQTSDLILVHQPVTSLFYLYPSAVFISVSGNGVNKHLNVAAAQLGVLHGGGSSCLRLSRHHIMSGSSSSVSINVSNGSAVNNGNEMSLLAYPVCGWRCLSTAGSIGSAISRPVNIRGGGSLTSAHQCGNISAQSVASGGLWPSLSASASRIVISYFSHRRNRSVSKSSVISIQISLSVT